MTSALSLLKSGALSPNRTDDLPLTTRLLYQLSYRGSDAKKSGGC